LIRLDASLIPPEVASHRCNSSFMNRQQFLHTLFPQGIPSLWCPALTHYGAEGQIDAPRIGAHLLHLAPQVKGLLIPGSTGDGWQMTDEEMMTLLDVVLRQAQELRLNVLIGILKPEAWQAVGAIERVLKWLKSRVGENDSLKAMGKTRVCGFTVCPPRGEAKSQSDMAAGLSSVLQLGLPTALYQLPQVTKNEMSPELVSQLAERFQNFLYFKDTSGADRAVLSKKDLFGVFAMRGAEGDYFQWIGPDAPYRGFLLSTANCFGAELNFIMQSRSSDPAAAEKLSRRLTIVVNEMFELVSPLPVGNPFTNINKAMDHFFAHGPGAENVPPPRLYGGSQLPVEVIKKTGQILGRHELLPKKGYLY
jgi:dihydrodipicolinate synthase/N-acetylneuraminate lyase